MKMCNIFFLICLMFLVSCGKPAGSSGSSETSQESLRDDLTNEEKALALTLLQNKTLSQKDLLKEILKLKVLGKKTLLKLDRYVAIECLELEQLCQFTSKENL